MSVFSALQVYFAFARKLLVRVLLCDIEAETYSDCSHSIKFGLYGMWPKNERPNVSSVVRLGRRGVPLTLREISLECFFTDILERLRPGRARVWLLRVPWCAVEPFHLCYGTSVFEMRTWSRCSDLTHVRCKGSKLRIQT